MQSCIVVHLDWVPRHTQSIPVLSRCGRIYRVYSTHETIKYGPKSAKNAKYRDLVDILNFSLENTLKNFSVMLQSFDHRGLSQL